jgi:hypothetical protein
MHQLATTELVDEVGGTWFDVWIPQGARHRRISMHEIVAVRDAIQMSIARTYDIPLEQQASRWRNGGSLAIRTKRLADGHLVSVLGDHGLDVVRHVRHWKANLRVHVRVALGWQVGWQVHAIAEGLAASLQIR